jgi:hypothetical protein
MRKLIYAQNRLRQAKCRERRILKAVGKTTTNLRKKTTASPKGGRREKTG